MFVFISAPILSILYCLWQFSYKSFKITTCYEPLRMQNSLLISLVMLILFKNCQDNYSSALIGEMPFMFSRLWSICSYCIFLPTTRQHNLSCRHTPFTVTQHNTTQQNRVCTYVHKYPDEVYCSLYSNSLLAEPSVDQIPPWARFPTPVHTAPGTHPASFKIDNGSLSLV